MADDRPRDRPRPGSGLTVGHVLAGRYVLAGPLGRGGMATVYEGHDAKLLRAVAVKVLHGDIARSALAMRRLDREIQIASAVEHGGFAAIYGAHLGHDPPFYVMEYVPGMTVAELRERLETLPERLVLDIARQIALGLEALHELGVVHRDIKPGNLILTPDHEVKIVDLGIAHVVDALGDEREALETRPARLTWTHDFVGTPEYAAPEQFQGAAITPGADLYSLGVVLYETATGSNPFRGDGMYESMRRHCDTTPARPSSIRPQLSTFFDQVVACLLEKRPEDRFRSAAELAETLEDGERSAWFKRHDERLRTLDRHGALRGFDVSHAPPWVGRDPELGFLLDCHREALGGSGRLVLLEGEAGIGKSRLVAELVARVVRDHPNTILLAGCHQPRTTARGPGAFGDALVAHYGHARLEAAIARLVPDLAELAAAFAAALLGTTLPEAHSRLSDEAIETMFCRVAAALAATGPVLWITEDLHFGSAASRSLLFALARACAALPVLLIATTRPGLPATELAQLGPAPGAHRRSIGRLGDDVVDLLIAASVPSPALASELSQMITPRADGVPFFVAELLSDLADRGYLRHTPAGLARGKPLAGASVPRSIRDLLGARLDGLSDDDRALLEVAAVNGLEFDPDLVARVLERKRLAVLRALASLERRRGVVRGTADGFRFDHHLLMEVVYEGMAPVLRAELHAELARAYAVRAGLEEAEPGAAPGQSAVFLAEHFLRGGEAAAGERWVRPALDHLASHFRHEGLQALAQLALEALAEGRSHTRAAIRLVQGRSLSIAGKRAEEREALEDAVVAAGLSGDGALRARTRFELGVCLHRVGALAEARALFEETASWATTAGNRRLRAEASGALGVLFNQLGQLDQARAQFEAQLDLARSLDDRQAEARALGGLGLIARSLGDDERARQLLQQKCYLCRAIGDRIEEALAVSNLGVLHWQRGEYVAARELFQAQLDLSRTLGHRKGEAFATANLGTVAHDLGRYPEAHQHYRRHVALCRELGDRWSEASTTLNLGMLALDEGRLDAARRSLDAALELARELGAAHLVAPAMIGLGDLEAARRAPALARERYTVALEHSRQRGSKDVAATALVAIGRLEIEAGDHAAARRSLEAAMEVAGHAGGAVPGPLAAAYLALIGARRPESVVLGDNSPATLRAEAHAVLYRASGDRLHRDGARQLLTQISAHLDDGERKLFQQASPAARLLADELTTE